MSNEIRRLTELDETKIRRFLLRSGDQELAMHRQLKDYFLTESQMFGAFGVFCDDALINLVLWSRYGPTTFVHYTSNRIEVDAVVEAAGGFPAEIFVKDPDVLHEPWIKTLDVTPGFVIDHPAYEGVFSRVAPRFKGSVYRHE